MNWSEITDKQLLELADLIISDGVVTKKSLRDFKFGERYVVNLSVGNGHSVLILMRVPNQ